MGEPRIDALEQRVTGIDEAQSAVINLLDQLRIEVQAGFAGMRKELAALRQENQKQIAALRDENRIMLQMLDERLPRKKPEE